MPIQSNQRSLRYRTHNIRSDNGVIKSGYETDQYAVKSWTNVRIGEDNPLWRWQVRHGFNATTSLTGTERDWFDVPIVSDFTQIQAPVSAESPRRWQVSQAVFGHTPTSPGLLDTARVDVQARQDFVSNYRKARTGFQTGVFLGELAETVHMIRNPAKALRDGLNAYYSDVKKRMKRKGKSNKVVQNTWLEYVFGWAPLIHDVRDACSLATADPYRVFQVLEGEASDSFKSAQSRDTVLTSVVGGPRFVRYHRTQTKISVRYKGAIRASNNPPGFPEQLGLSWSNLLPTVWELIPYSFMVDYFSNVGRVIEGISTGVITLAWGCKNVIKESESHCDGTFFDEQYNNTNFGSGNWTGFASGSGVTGRFKDVNRDATGSVSVGVTDAQFRLPGSSTKWLNIAALASLRR